MKAAIYVRVSTGGQSYEQQREPCESLCRMKGWGPCEVFSEVMSTGKARPVFQEVLRRARAGEFTHIVVFRLDRAWRSAREFLMDFDNLQARGITIASVMEGLDPSTPVGKAFMTILVALAELEKANISQATKERLHALRNLGKTLGRPKGSKDSRKRGNIGYLIREAKKRGDTKTLESLEGIRHGR